MKIKFTVLGDTEKQLCEAAEKEIRKFKEGDQRIFIEGHDYCIDARAEEVDVTPAQGPTESQVVRWTGDVEASW